ncbi:MAG: DUF1553 domain-containing protein [Bryobacteraceae bacterium]|nr:DUF1553 domain-containing protein [Bryobacteraceae bacterium]
MLPLVLLTILGAETFEEQAKPILQARCAGCHNARLKQGGLSVATRDDLLAGGQTGAAIVPGNAVDSLLLSLVMNGKMPKSGPPLRPEETARLRRWIEAGALTEGEQVVTRLVSEREILAPILGAKCFVCHGRREQRGGLDLRTRASMLKGGKSGAAIIPGQPEQSLLVKRIAAQQMPPPALQEQYCVRTVDSAELEKLKQWIAQGARADDEQPAKVDAKNDPAVPAKAREFWSFRPPVRARVPDLPGRTPVDSFLLEKLAAKKLTYSTEASKLTLLRRVYFSLTGLPPTPSEVKAYLADTRPDAYERLVDQLLASPRYGERWARSWLDAAGYSDSEGGVSSDALRPTAWRYRDYVIRALNADRPYNEFLTEQLAGDELFDYRAERPYSPRQADLLAATGFLRQAPDSTYSTEQNFLPERFDAVAAEMEILGTAVMGLSLGCARCHDHKYDPLPQRDYYRVSAIFQSALDPYDWRIPNMECGGVGAKCEEKNLRFLPDLESAEAKSVQAHNAPLEQQIAEIEQQVEAAAKPYRKSAETVDELIKKNEDLRKQVTELRKGLTKLRNSLKPTPGYRALFDMGGEPTPVRILLRGDPNNPGPLVAPGPPSVLSASLPNYEAIPPPYETGTSGRRLAFAKWLTHPQHPLTARVIVNRIWQQHFGNGIVKSAGNFGKMGTPPTHPELLDWLAVEFVESGWSLKKLHRLIVTSAVYRQSSAVSDAALTQDPANTWLSRFPLRRLDAEAVRDAVLKTAGRLDETEFGPPAPIDVKPDGAVLPKPGKLGYRRSIYVTQRRSTPVTMLDAFDAPFMSPNCIRRGESIVSSQALQMMNGEQIRESARYLAGRVIDAAGLDPAGQLERLYLTVLSRPPSPAELTAGVTTLDGLAAQWRTHYTANPSPEPIAAKAAHMALATVAHTLFNTAEFLYVD